MPIINPRGKEHNPTSKISKIPFLTYNEISIMQMSKNMQKTLSTKKLRNDLKHIMAYICGTLSRAIYIYIYICLKKIEAHCSSWHQNCQAAIFKCLPPFVDQHRHTHSRLDADWPRVKPLFSHEGSLVRKMALLAFLLRPRFGSCLNLSQTNRTNNNGDSRVKPVKHRSYQNWHSWLFYSVRDLGPT